MSFPLLSVIVPVYNTELFLSRCLDSLIGQTYKELEIICVDDGSTDNSLAILLKYKAKDARIKVIHQENAGVSEARNKGLAAAAGELVAFVDSDDWLENDAYEHMLSCMRDDIDLLWYGTKVDGEVDLEYRRIIEHHLEVCSRGKHKLSAFLCRAMGGEIWNKLFRLSIIKKYEITFPVGLPYGEDKAFSYTYMTAATKVYCLPERCYHYVVRAGSAMSDYAKRDDVAAMARRLFDHVMSFAHIHHFSRSKVRSIMSILYEEYLACALPSASEEFRGKAYLEGKTLGLLNQCHHPAILAMRQQYMPWWKRLFHGFVQNREFFGIGKWHIASITYEYNRKVYRCLGYCLGSIYTK